MTTGRDSRKTPTFKIETAKRVELPKTCRLEKGLVSFSVSNELLSSDTHTA